jgi:hypothetical protein
MATCYSQRLGYARRPNLINMTVELMLDGKPLDETVAERSRGARFIE